MFSISGNGVDIKFANCYQFFASEKFYRAVFPTPSPLLSPQLKKKRKNFRRFFFFFFFWSENIKNRRLFFYFYFHIVLGYIFLILFLLLLSISLLNHLFLLFSTFSRVICLQFVNWITNVSFLFFFFKLSYLFVKIILSNFLLHLKRKKKLKKCI